MFSAPSVRTPGHKPTHACRRRLTSSHVRACVADIMPTRDPPRRRLAACFCPTPPSRYACLLIAAADVNSDEHTGPELAALVHPDVPWHGGPEYEQDLRRSLVEINGGNHRFQPPCQISRLLTTTTPLLPLT